MINRLPQTTRLLLRPQTRERMRPKRSEQESYLQLLSAIVEKPYEEVRQQAGVAAQTAPRPEREPRMER
ncbi:MAG: hypothetical protein HKN82_16255 [Akkermansiaceae bacterium]|nr:hypothetical protein [Akkermansiaceae bacterium]NNM29230.1 hypothetical protein [Akkermansiaceae bacterium]